MKRFIYVCMLFGLGSSACQKESTQTLVEIETASPTQELELDIYGIKYNKDSILKEMSIGTGFPIDSIFFDESVQKFKVTNFYIEFNPEDYLKLLDR